MIALVVVLIMFCHDGGLSIYGAQNLSTETYKTTPDAFSKKPRPWWTSTQCELRQQITFQWLLLLALMCI